MALKKTVRELLAAITPAELVCWRAFDRIDPFGAERMDLGFAQVAATVANCHRSKDAEPFALRDFMWEYKPPVELNDKTRAKVADQVEQYFGVMLAKQDLERLIRQQRQQQQQPPTIPAAAPGRHYPLKDDPTPPDPKV